MNLRHISQNPSSPRKRGSCDFALSRKALDARRRGHEKGMKIRARIVFVLLATLCLTLAPHAHAQDATLRILHQGHLEKSGVPVTEQHEFRLNLYANEAGGTPLNATPYEFARVDLHDGEYRLSFDLPTSVNPATPLWLEISLRPFGTTTPFVTLSPRSRFATAAQAQHAFSVTSAAQLAPGSIGSAQIIPTQVQRRVLPSCASGNVISSITAVGVVDCVTPPNTPTIVREVIASSGLSGGGSSGTVYVEVASAGITDNLLIEDSIDSIDIADGAANATALANDVVNLSKINTAQVQARVGGTCPTGKAITRVNADGSVVCGVTSVAGIFGNTTGSANATVLHGRNNQAQGLFSIVLMGDGSQALAQNSVAGQSGYRADYNATTASGNQATSLGPNNTASGNWSVAAGGRNCAGGHYSVALGELAKIRLGTQSGAPGLGCANVPVSDTYGDQGTFVWNDGSADFTSVGDDRFLLRSANGYYFGGSGAPSVNIPNNRLINTSTGARLTNGGNWTNASSRALKQAFSAVDASAVLDQVLALPLGRWQYLNAAGDGWHLGPAAEDFSAAFGLGASAQHITSVDANGVALVAVQGLAERIEREQRETLDALERENMQLHEALARLNARLARMDGREVLP